MLEINLVSSTAFQNICCFIPLPRRYIFARCYTAVMKKINRTEIKIYYFQGATIKADEETGKIVVARIMHGGAADRSGLIHVGDEVVEVNGINVEGKTPNDVLKILVGFTTAHCQ